MYVPVPLIRDNYIFSQHPAHGPLIIKSVSLAAMQLTFLPQRCRQKVHLKCLPTGTSTWCYLYPR